MANNLIKSMMNYFQLTYKNTGGKQKIIYPAKRDPITNLPTSKPVEYTTEIQKMLDDYLNDVYETRDSVKDRIKRYNDLDGMVKNDGYIDQAVEMYTDESTQVDSQGNIIQVTADSKLEKWINDFFMRIGIFDENLIRDATYNISLFGDAFLVHDINKSGIVGVYPISPYNITDRLEFHPPQISELLKKRNKYFSSAINSNSILQNIAKSMGSDKEVFNTSDYFRSFLFGFVIEDGDMFLPPWMVTHFRRFASQSEFFPFGRPLLINTLSPYKQYTSAKVIQQMLRQNAFPIKVWEIDTGEFANARDKWHAVNQFKNEYQNLGQTQSQKEPIIASEVFMPRDQATLQVHDSRIDLNQIADIENLEQNMITSTGIPPSAILPGQGGFGNSGESMLRQDKKFARKVYTIQSAILQGLTEMVHLQMAITGDFDYNTAKFELSMHFPVVEEDNDRIRNFSDKLRLANDIVDNFGTAMGLDRDEKLPAEVVKQIFSKYSFIPAEEVESWSKSIEKQRASMDSENGEVFEKNRKKLLRRVESISYDDLISEYIDSKRRRSFLEGSMFGRHYYSSFKVSKEKKPFLEEIQRVYKKGGSEVLNESLNSEKKTYRVKKK